MERSVLLSAVLVVVQLPCAMIPVYHTSEYKGAVRKNLPALPAASYYVLSCTVWSTKLNQTNYVFVSYIGICSSVAYAIYAIQQYRYAEIVLLYTGITINSQ